MFKIFSKGHIIILTDFVFQLLRKFGYDSKEVELQNIASHIQKNYFNDSTFSWAIKKSAKLILVKFSGVFVFFGNIYIAYQLINTGLYILEKIEPDFH